MGKDGIHGATFSSIELDETSPATAVQIGSPITQKLAMDFLILLPAGALSSVAPTTVRVACLLALGS
ncbi:hypothetical protein [Hymenobacter sp. AT01-02]|uniref:hypothetical protein n=1 Tax=Hymenobacter sp. AT01-02 TaxID=1571877 RepID=UPI000ACD2FDA|nr:hypothetical protein [Hymenobacter sp. AT01-02]